MTIRYNVLLIKQKPVIMILDDIIDKIKEAQCPSSFSSDLNIGVACVDERNDKLFEFFPSDSCSSLAQIRQYQENACVNVHTHGVEVVVDNVRINIHNSQIIVFDCYYFDDTIEYKRSDSRGSRVGLGMMLAGPVGAAVGLASSFGKSNKHIKSHNLVIAYWDTKTKQKEIILLENRKGVAENIAPNLVEYWQEQVKINDETGRTPTGDNKAGVGDAGCLSVLLPFAFGGLYTFYKVIEYIVC